MAKTIKKAEPVIPVLTRDKESLKAQIKVREKIGAELVNRPITTKEEKQQMWDEFISWNKYNEELIK